MPEPAIKAVAFYLPQFHPTPENDRWWGPGFTEWTNVARAVPLFPGHAHPRVPADLGYCDPRLPEVRQAQADLAREHGIHGFCYYHYWFHGKRLLERPFQEVLDSGRPDFPFCLCWANENWTRAWDGQSQECLMEQTYSERDDLEHIRWLARAFRDSRYIRVGGKPLFLVYRAGYLPDPRRTAELWRSECLKQGVGEIYLCSVESNYPAKYKSPLDMGFDGSVEHHPHGAFLGTPQRRGLFWSFLEKLRLSPKAYREHRLYDYSGYVARALDRPDPGYCRMPCVMPGWDNSPRRRQGAVILKGASPRIYEAWLAAVVRGLKARGSEAFVFINAWNEWAEGTCLEPDLRNGRAYLEATKRVLNGETP
ncbi:MAG: glycoside hydrolase family 99-like domain-containing protein [Elusimicrobia bacterium]|nr:glycoside hydrolase family 99-like domain-containing protein [Elusimicrobiota bacterium]